MLFPICRPSSFNKLKARHIKAPITVPPTPESFFILKSTKKPKKYDLPHTWKVNHPYRMYKVESRFESELQKAIEKQELDDAVNKYLENGGKIKKLEEMPAPSLPSVGSREWEWETRVGLGFVGPDSVADQNYIDIEILEYLVSKR